MDTTYLQTLNNPQRLAAEHYEGPILVLAGAGSGKTRVLTCRVAHLVLNHGVRPDNILAVTFTNKAAGEMKERLTHLLGEQSTRLWVSTFHSFGLRILRRHAQTLGYSNDFVVYDDQDTKSLLKSALKVLAIDEKQYSVNLFRSAIDRYKNQAMSVEKALDEASNSYEVMSAGVYEYYQRELLQSNAMDFGDLLFNVLRLFKADPEVLSFYQDKFSFLLVDEFQDTNLVQYHIIKLLSAKSQNIFAVGDDDQSIYAFRGATIKNILNFEKDFQDAKLIKLEQNYRSTSNILDAAHGVIEKNSDRKSKKLWTATKGGEGISLYCGLDEHDEAEFIAQTIRRHQSQGVKLSDCACFYRTNAQSRALEEALMSAGIPYRIFGGLKFYDRKEVKDILAYVRLTVNENDNQAFLRIVNNPPRGIGPQTVKNVVDQAIADSSSLYQSAQTVAQKSRPIREFVALVESLKEMLRVQSLHAFIGSVMEKTEYIKRLEISSDPQSESRIENLKELQAITMLYHEPHTEPRELVQAFLDRVSLASGEEVATNIPLSEQTASDEYVSLMTLHLAKGLEYPIVFLTGFEEGLLPHERSKDSPFEMSEERRLCYVGITRAMKKLYITRSRRRGMFFNTDSYSSGVREPSRFAFDIPSAVVEERSGFFDAYEPSTPHGFDILDDIFVDEQPRSIQKPTIKKKTPFNPTNFIFSAKDLLYNQEKTSKGHLATAEDLHTGVEVIHPSFGKGVVEETDGNPEGDPKKFKVRVVFEGRAGAKNLIFKFANLTLANSH